MEVDVNLYAFSHHFFRCIEPDLRIANSDRALPGLSVGNLLIPDQ